ncbi:hypothetical protein ABZT04_36635 [Streptomyces sp. NPDC005492]|uniref:hypothetical protein n=1 Tax=Streptomyces sp. NPDC005492 TaxID=3156883 RepID=UPI0033A5C11C
MEVVVVVGLHAEQLEDLSPRGGELTGELHYVDLFLVVVAPEIGADPAGIKGNALVLVLQCVDLERSFRPKRQAQQRVGHRLNGRED